MIIDIKNQRDPVLPGCEELVYGKRPKAKEKKKKEKKKKSEKDFQFSGSILEEKKRVVCGIEKVLPPQKNLWVPGGSFEEAIN